MKKNKDYTIGSDNVFADLGLPNPGEELAKAELTRQINAIIKQRVLTQSAAAELLDVDQPKISALGKGRLSGFSLERLFRFLNILDQDITIKISQKTKSKKRAGVSVALPRIKKLPAAKNPSNTASLSIQARKKK